MKLAGNVSATLRCLIVSASVLMLPACSVDAEEGDATADELNGSADPRTWNAFADLEPAAGAYLLRSAIHPGSLAKCPLYPVVTVDESYQRLLFEERPLYYDLDASYVQGLRNLSASGSQTQIYLLHHAYGEAKLENGVVSGKASPYLGGTPSTLEFYKAQDAGNLRVRFTVESGDESPNLVCEYERMANTVKEMAPGVIETAQSAWEAAKSFAAASNDARITELCKAITTNPYWSAGEWSKGFCDAPAAATNRDQIVQTLDGALKSLAKEKLGITDPRAAYGGDTRGEELLYRVSDSRAVFGGFAPTDVYAEELERAARKERCADQGLTDDACKLHGLITAAFLVEYHDD